MHSFTFVQLDMLNLYKINIWYANACENPNIFFQFFCLFVYVTLLKKNKSITSRAIS